MYSEDFPVDFYSVPPASFPVHQTPSVKGYNNKDKIFYWGANSFLPESRRLTVNERNNVWNRVVSPADALIPLTFKCSLIEQHCI